MNNDILSQNEIDSFNEDGFLHLKNVLNREDVLNARKFLMESIGLNEEVVNIDDQLNSLSTSSNEKNAKKRKREKMESNSDQKQLQPSLLDRQDLCHQEIVLKILENQKLFKITKQLLNIEKVKTISYKWMRAVTFGKNTGLHCDRVFFQSQIPNFISIWIPFGDIPKRQGGLEIYERSHNSADTAKIRKEYATTNVGKDGTTSGYLPLKFEKDLKNLRIYCSDFYNAGDLVLLHPDTLHQTLINETQQTRISCDVRFVPFDSKSIFVCTTKPFDENDNN